MIEGVLGELKPDRKIVMPGEACKGVAQEEVEESLWPRGSLQTKVLKRMYT